MSTIDSPAAMIDSVEACTRTLRMFGTVKKYGVFSARITQISASAR